MVDYSIRPTSLDIRKPWDKVIGIPVNAEKKIIKRLFVTAVIEEKWSANNNKKCSI